MLIVDDTEINLILFAALIKKLDNCVATTFSNATQGLQWAAAQVPDLVIVDYMMPGCGWPGVHPSAQGHARARSGSGIDDYGQ